MAKISAIFIIFSFLLLTPLFGNDLYLLTIENNQQLNRVQDIVAYAHGTIDDQFIVDLNKSQIEALKTNGIKIQLLQADCRLDETYLVLKEHFRITSSAVNFNSLYETNNRQITSLEKSSLDILSREGYMAFSLSDKKTPFFYAPPVFPTASLDSYPTDSLANLINIDSLYSYVTRMEQFYTRFTPTDSNASARYWLKSKLQSFGYTDITFQYFLATREWMNVFNEPAWNVICVKEGTEFPDEYIIIGAHYDSYSSNDYDYPAPGADDNASGVSAVLELARIFKDIDFRRTLIFVGFGAEEQGLWGAHHMADEMYENEANIELMVNYDIISYEANGIYEVNISTVRQKGYGQVFVDAASRLETDLIPIKGNYPSWDDDPFFEYGFQTSAFFEYEFHPDMHTAWDLSSTIDFEYMRQIITMAAAGLPIIDAAPEPIQFELADVGNGEALRVSWDSCFANWSYQIIYGNSENELIDTIDVPPLTCQYDIYGLSEGVRYYAGVIGQPDVGPGPIGYYVNSNRPCIVPLAPNNFIAIPENDGVSLNWESNTEVDLSHYKIIRKVTGELGWSLLIDNVTDSFYTDLSAEKYKNNFYIIFAVDNDFNESDSSELAVAIPASLDAGILFVDETQDVDGFPTEAQQTTFYSAILDTFSFSSYKIDEGDYLTRSTAGQYNPLFWVDDDLVHKELPGSLDTLAWYLDFETNLLLAGWSTIYSMTGQTYFYPGDFFYDQFGITYIAENSNLDFAGATGLNGWPDLEINTALVPLGRMSNIDRFAVNNKAEVILTFNSSTGNPAYANKPVGVAYDSRHGKRILLGFPLYYLTESSAKAFIEKAMSYFAEESIVYYGDVNDDWNVNILDITYLITFLYKGGPAPIIMNNGDPNASCNINILDITYLIGYLYKDGPDPIEGCVE